MTADKKFADRLRDVIDLLEGAIQDGDWELVEEAVEELRSLLGDLEES